MTELKDHHNALPTRKILAVIISGAVVGALQTGLALLWPDHPFTPLMADIGVWVQWGVMVTAGYVTRNTVDD